MNEDGLAELGLALDAMRPIIAEATQGRMRADGLFVCAVRAGLAKAYHFAEVACLLDEQEPNFFLTASMRGIVEDLITFTFLATLAPDDRETYVKARLNVEVADNLDAQIAFLRVMRPGQVLLRPQPEARERQQRQLNDLAKRHGWKGNARKGVPKVRWMAEQTGLAPFYDFLYKATSQWVHNSPHILLRMGWGKERATKEGADPVQAYSPRHFTGYYHQFNRIYGCLLLCEYLARLGTFLGSAQQDPPISISLRAALDEYVRWPEIVTPEEIDQPPPPIIRFVQGSRSHPPG